MTRPRSDFCRRVLEHVDQETGYRPDWYRRVLRPGFMFGATVLALAAFLLSLYLAGETARILKVLSVIGGGAVFLLTYIQWRLGRQEASFEKYYDRMDATIQQISQYGLEEAGNDQSRRIDHLGNIRTFMQLDNIEYVFGKYRQGYIETDILDRALRNFKSECQQDWFRGKALYWLGTIQTYTPDTVAAARYIVKHYQWPL